MKQIDKARFILNTLFLAGAVITFIIYFVYGKCPAFMYAGFATLANMVLMGKVMKETGVVSFENNKSTFEAFIPAKKVNLIEVNCQALQTGYDYI